MSGPGDAGKGVTPYLPDNMEVAYSSHDQRGVLRPTVTDGEIIIRDNPDMDLSGLNRDIDRAREITKDERTYVDVYLSPEAIRAIANALAALIPAEGPDTVVTVQDAMDAAYAKAIAEGRSEEEARAIANTVDANIMFIRYVEAALEKYGSYDNMPPEVIAFLIARQDSAAFIWGGPSEIVDTSEFISGMLVEANVQGGAALDFMTTYAKGAVGFLTSGLVCSEEAAFYQAVNNEISRLPEKLISGEFSKEFRDRFDSAFRSFDLETDPYKKGRALVQLLGVTAELFTPQILVASPSLLEFNTLRAVTEKLKSVLDVPIKTFHPRMTIEDIKTKKLYTYDVDLTPTLDRISRGEKFPHKNDSTPFRNEQHRLPIDIKDYYTEYVHPTPDIPGAGPQRLIFGKGGEIYYTPDHYTTFIRIR